MGAIYGPTESRRRVVITGVGCVSAAGKDLRAAMASMSAGVRKAGPPTRLETDHSITYPVFEVADADLPEEVQRGPDYFRCSQYGLMAVQQALDCAGLSKEDLDKIKTGVCLGTTVGSALNDEDFYLHFREKRFPGMSGVKDFLNANPAAAVVRHLGTTGPWQTVTHACSSGTVAIGEAASWVASGVCDLVLAGGTEAITRVSYDGFACLMIMDPKPCRPFDLNRRGLSLGEGAGVLVLESESMAIKRGAPVYGVVLGYGNGCDAHHLSAPHPEGLGLSHAIDDALKMSSIHIEEIGFINAHGTGTVDNDRVEGRVFATRFPGVPYFSTKGFTGHALGAAGGIEAAITVQCLNDGRIPGNAGFQRSDPAFQGDPVAETTPIDAEYAMSVSVAFGGNNAVLIVGRGEG